MSTTTGRHEDEPIDGPVRQLFWRLRARLVTPPSEQRANADLDRLIGLAHVQAHEAPSAGAMSKPPVGGPAIAMPPDHPVTIARDGLDVDRESPVAEPAALPYHEDEVAARRRLVSAQAMTRVAAAAMVVFAFGAGLAGARDGSVIRLDALLGRDEVPDVDPAIQVPELAAPSESDEDAGDAEVADDTASSQVQPSDDANSGAPGAGDARDTTDASPTPAPAPDDVEATEPAPPAPPAPKPTKPKPPAGDEQIIAAPPPDDLDGFGGPKPCDQPKLEDCLPADDTDTSDSGSDEDASDGSSTEDAEAEAEQLASRRFGGSSTTP
jgi:hypothetical protein